MRISLPDDTHEQPPETTIPKEDALEMHALPFREALRQKRAATKKKWQELSPEERSKFFKDYYLKLLIIICIVILAAVLIIRAVYLGNRPSALRLAILNTTLSDDDMDQLKDMYRESLDLPTNNTVSIATYEISYEVYSSQKEYWNPSSTSDYTVLNIYLQSDYFDAIIVDEEDLPYLTDFSLIKDMQSIFSEDELSTLSDYIYYAQITNDDGSTATLPVGLTLPDNEKTDAFCPSYNDRILVFPSDKEQAKTNLDRLISFFCE